MRLHIPNAGFAILPALLLSLAACDVQDDGRPKSAETLGSEDAGDADRELSNGQRIVAGSYRPLADRNSENSSVVPAVDMVVGQAAVVPDMSNPYGDGPEVVAAGRRHFGAFNCSGCHAPLGGGGMGPSLSDDAWVYGEEPAQIYLTIVHGRPAGMPSWGTMLPEKVIWELVAYIRTLDEIENPAEHEGFVRRPLPDFQEDSG